MKIKVFFKSSLRDIDDELAEIDPSKYFIDFGEALPGEEVLGEMNDFEKKVFIWNSLMLDEIIKVSENEEKESFWADSKLVDLYVSEFAIMNAKIKLLEYRLFRSLLERFGPKPLAFRGKFQVVLSKESKEDIKANIEKLKKAVLIMFSSNTGKSIH